jgi:hypothetical protein
MILVRKKIYLLITLLFSLNLVACGGGGGGGSSSPGFSVSSNEINVGVLTNSGQAPDQTITGTVSNYSGPLYIVITHTNNGIGTIYLPVISGNSGTSTMSMQFKSQGVYTDVVTVQACSDPACANQLPGSPKIINVTYSVGIAVFPQALNFSATAGSAPAPQSVKVHYNSGGLSLNNWASSFLYLDGTGWMSYTPPSGQAPTDVEVTLNAFPASTAPGVYNAEIRFGANEGKTLVTLPIQYTVN